MNYSNKYSKSEMIKIICKSAKKYKQNLLNKNILFIYQEKNTNNIEFIETIFSDRNFLHLTGIKYPRKANVFFKNCLNGKISPELIKQSRFTQLKLEILENSMSIQKSAKRIGNYNWNKVNIKIEKVIGNTSYCLGFSNIGSNNKKLKYYYPKTLIQDNLKNNVKEDNRIIFIFSKSINQTIYNEVTYINKEATFESLKEKEDIIKLVNYKKLYSLNSNYQKKIEEFFKNQQIINS